MAEIAYTTTRQANGTHSVVRSTGGSILSGAQVAVVIDNTASKIDVIAALEAAARAVHRDGVAASSPAAYPTATTTVE